MQVSAINLDNLQKSNKTQTKINVKGFDNYKFLYPFNKNKKDMQKVYYDINLWKFFCHKQILEGNFDILM